MNYEKLSINCAKFQIKISKIYFRKKDQESFAIDLLTVDCKNYFFDAFLTSAIIARDGDRGLIIVLHYHPQTRILRWNLKTKVVQSRIDEKFSISRRPYIHSQITECFEISYR